MTGLNKYTEKERREMRRRAKKERDLRYPKRNRTSQQIEEYDEPT